MACLTIELTRGRPSIDGLERWSKMDFPAANMAKHMRGSPTDSLQDNTSPNTYAPGCITRETVTVSLQLCANSRASCGTATVFFTLPEDTSPS